ncbi:E3 ubiquitin-protein ligase MSL2a [Misgurnus anguillicaudatus]|uniref:E3 ubiquitin-protein ligase MSL2a n=1 Tax=Misgurnus anguillicaudatus TaxID=75329 RepID=UPI003CCF5D52
MNPINATSLYVSACRSLMQCDPQNPETCAELFNVLAFFRDSLSCLVCGNLLQDPIAPKNSFCQHYVCEGCRGKKMSLKPSCSWCKDWDQFEENKQLQILTDCYRSLCEYVSVCITNEQSTSGVKGYPEVKKLLEEVLGVKEEEEESSVFDAQSPARDTLDASHIKMEASSPECTADVEESGSDDVTDNLLTQTELETHEPAVVNVNEPLNTTELETDAVNVTNSNVGQVTVVENPESESVSRDHCNAQQHKPGVPCGQTNTVTEPCQQSPGQPQTGMTCLAAPHRKVRVSRKRSRSESDSEMLQPLPIASLMQGPPVAPTTPPKAPCEHKAPSSPTAVVTNGGILKVNKAMLDLTKNIQVNTDAGNKKVQPKSKVAVTKSKGKTKDRMLPASMLAGQPTKVVYKKTQEKKGCKCGRATQNPSVLTCRGQRCPCYSNRKACLDCICRGCQNSYMANGEKKLEAFAVPEKALEQTRLTLGINLTSISVRNAGSNAGVLSLSAGSPMASFLASSADEDQNFEDALEMHFDC